MAEEFALDNGFTDGGTIDRNEIMVRTPAVVVDRPGHQLLAGSGFPLNQDRCIIRTHLGNQPFQI